MQGNRIITLGNDWEGKFNKLSCKCVYLPRTPGISTSEIKRRIKLNENE